MLKDELTIISTLPSCVNIYLMKSLL